MENHSYQVQLEAFTGPLDLLLHLIEQQHLDITTISLARVTDQYLAYLHMLQERRPDELADFVVIAARLLLIKSRALLPRPPEILKDQEDVGEDLVQQLRDYKRFKQISAILGQRDQDGRHMYLRTIPTAQILNLEPRVDLAGTTLDDLIETLRAMLVDEPQVDEEPSVAPHRVTISQTIERISTLLKTQRTVTFDELFDNTHSRVEIIVTLLAVLELIRLHRAWARQERLFGPISITALERGRQEADGEQASAGEAVPEPGTLPQ